MTLGHLHHTNLRITDPVASLRFYRAFGFKLVGFMDLGTPAGPLSTAFGRRQLPGMAMNVTDDSSWDTNPGSGHVALTVHDLNAELTRLTDLHGMTRYHPRITQETAQNSESASSATQMGSR